MLSNKLMDRISLFCYALVSHMFATMHNPRMRGDKFEWDAFPEMMEDHCRVILCTFMSYSKNIKLECEDHAAKTGREIATDLVKWMTE